MVDIEVIRDSSSSMESIPWQIRRGGHYERNVREYLEDMGNAISVSDIDSTFDEVANLMSYLPNPSSWNDHHSAKRNEYCTALLFGKVQSGKTLASCALSALAFDNGYRTIIVLTSNSNLLCEQTKSDYQSYLSDIELLPEIKESNFERVFTEFCNFSDEDKVVIVLKKEPVIMENLIQILESGHRNHTPTIIIDDEGDQASMNISRSEDESRIHEAIKSIRNTLKKECLITVTATPYANFRLDPEKEKHLYPTIFKTLKPGTGYCGYETFFRGDLSKNWVDLNSEFNYVANDLQTYATSLDGALAYHFVAAAIRQLKENFGPHTMLVNSATERSEHNEIQRYIDEKIEKWRICTNDDGKWKSLVENQLQPELNRLRNTLEFSISISDRSFFTEFRKVMKKAWCRTQIINMDNPEPPAFDSANPRRISPLILIGSRSLSRGLRVKGLVTTFFTYSPDSTNMDTYHQMCRFFGYRTKILPYMRIFAPRSVFDRWLHISFFDQEMFEEVSSPEKDNSPVFIVRPDLSPSRYITAATHNEFRDLSNTGIFQNLVPDVDSTIAERDVCVRMILGSSGKYLQIKSDSRRARYKSPTSFPLTDLLELINLPEFSNVDRVVDNWHPKILSNAIRSVYMRPPYNHSEFEIFFLTHPDSNEFVERKSTPLLNFYHQIERYDEGTDRAMYKREANGKICLIFSRIQPKSGTKSTWVPMIYLPILDIEYRGGF